PVLARRTEDVDIERVLERFGFVRHIGWYVQHFAGSDHELLRAVLADPEAQRALEYVRYLLVVMRMFRDDAAFLQVHVRKHDSVARNQAPVERLGYFLAWHVVPAVPGHGRLVLHR